MADLLKGKNVQKRQGGNFTKIDPAEALKGKVVALYFSAHWCPPCRGFTPILKDFYETVQDKPFEVVFVSFDRSDADMKQYMKESHGNWSCIPFGDPTISELSKMYSVEGIPALVIIKPNGEVITKNGRLDLLGGAKGPTEVVNDWKKAAGM